MPVCDAEDPNRPGVKCTFREDLHKHRHSWEARKKIPLCSTAQCKKPMGHVGPHTQPQCIWSDNEVQCTFPKGHEGDHSYDCEADAVEEEEVHEDDLRRSEELVASTFFVKDADPRKKSKAVVGAFSKVFDALEELEPEERQRVIKAACVILDITVPAVQRPFR